MSNVDTAIKQDAAHLVVHASTLLALAALEGVRLSLLRCRRLRLEEILGDELAVFCLALLRCHVLRTLMSTRK